MTKNSKSPGTDWAAIRFSHIDLFIVDRDPRLPLPPGADKYAAEINAARTDNRTLRSLVCAS